MNPPAFFNGQEVIDIVSSHSNGIRLGRLIGIAAKRFGPGAFFHMSCHIGLDLDELLVYLEAHDRLVISKGVAFAPPRLCNAM
jgi:hypothetical protein